MRAARLSLTVAASLAVLACQTTPDALPADTVALAGQVTSAEEGLMEGVLVSAKRTGSSVTFTVVSDGQSQYRFP